MDISIKKPAKVDRRIQRTRQLLRDSLMGLIIERGYETITIQDITDRANLGRATFYLHFKDKDDLLISSLLEVYEGLVARFDNPSLESSSQSDKVANVRTFEHAAENAQLYRVLLREPGTVSIRQRIHEYIASIVRERYLIAIKPLDPAVLENFPADLVAEHIAGSLLSLIKWWLENDMPYSAEYMARLSREIGGRALFSYLSTIVDPSILDAQNHAHPA